jgi:hypothetical protein
MPLPAILPAAGALAAKLGIGAKLTSAIAAAKGLLGATAAKGGVGALGSRMAASKFATNAAALMPKTAAEWGMRVAPDAIFGTIAGAMTPGDLGDKMIAGTAATAGGALGGLALRGAVGGVAPGIMKNTVADISSEMVGGIGGDMLAQGVADNILRVKGGGSTPYEKMAADQQRELEQQILRQYMSGKGGYRTQDQFLAENGLV